MSYHGLLVLTLPVSDVQIYDVDPRQPHLVVRLGEYPLEVPQTSSMPAALVAQGVKCRTVLF